MLWLGKFLADTFKTERLVCVETDKVKPTRLVMLSKNTYTL